MSEEIITYINSRIVDRTSKVSGEITTVSRIALDTGEVIEGMAIRDITAYDANEAESSASDNAISALIPGIALALGKKG